MISNENDGPSGGAAPESGAAWRLRLYLNDQKAIKSVIAIQNARDLCEKHLDAGYDLEVVDLVENFARGQDDNIIALPTLVRISPLPVRKFVGDLSNTAQALLAMGLPLISKLKT